MISTLGLLRESRSGATMDRRLCRGNVLHNIHNMLMCLTTIHHIWTYFLTACKPIIISQIKSLLFSSDVVWSEVHRFSSTIVWAGFLLE